MVLTDTDAINFINSLIRPTAEEIQTKQNYIDNIHNNIHIVHNNSDFFAIVDDLDLSFLEVREDEL